MKFNRSELKIGNKISHFIPHYIEETPVLRRASIQIAHKFGGPIVREFLDKLPSFSDRNYACVDTKVSYLMKGWSPSIPGWHTDGVPRGETLSSIDKGLPNIYAQEEMKSPIYHLAVFGVNPTLFIRDRNIEIPIPDEPSRDLYSSMTKYVYENDFNTFEIEMNRIYTWDWWEVHAAQWAKENGWRLLIRVTESDEVLPNLGLDKVFRSQNQVYVNGQEIGW